MSFTTFEKERNVSFVKASRILKFENIVVDKRGTTIIAFPLNVIGEYFFIFKRKNIS